MTIIPPPPDTQTVVIQFEGVCVNFRQSDFPFLPAAHRIVMINASTITRVWDENIGPHMAGFSTDLSPDAPVTPISGSVAQITNAVSAGVHYVQPGEPGDLGPYADIPSLTGLTPGLSGPSLAVLVGHNHALTACCFDINDGVIGSKVSVLGATMTVVSIKTLGAPAYQLKPFPTGLSSVPISVLQSQPATNKMFFWNAESDPSQASINDFLLSYLVLSFPPVAPPNTPSLAIGNTENRKSAKLARLLGGLTGTDVGCSNSQYP